MHNLTDNVFIGESDKSISQMQVVDKASVN